MKYAWLGLAVVGLGLLGCSDDADEASKRLVVSLTYSGPVYQGDFYTGYLPATDHAMWIEDAQGNYVNTLQLSPGIAAITEHGSHLTHVPTWTATTGETDDSIVARIDTPDVDIPPEYDAVTGASETFFNEALGDTDSPTEATVTAYWDLRDYTGADVQSGTYRFCAEVANIVKDSVPGMPFPPDSVVHETCCGTVVLMDGPVTDATPTAHIDVLTADIID